MDSLLWAGTGVGAFLGVLHALYVYRLLAREAAVAPLAGHASPAYYALWTVGLWLLFGSYVLVLWLVGAVFYVAFKTFR